MTPQKSVTQLLKEGSRGDRAALDELLPLVYGELRRLAAAYMGREREGHTLQPTALVHEAYLRLVDQRSVEWQNRAHFFGLAAQAMRRILVTHAQARHREKRGGRAARLPLDDAVGFFEERDVNLAALDEALGRMEAFDPQQSVNYLKLSIFLSDAGQAAAAVERARQAVELGEPLAAANPNNSSARQTLASSYAQLGRGYASLAEEAATSVSLKKECWREARFWYQKSLDIWQDMKVKRNLSRADVGKPDEVVRALEKCDIALESLPF